jgi:hypothetical protein
MAALFNSRVNRRSRLLAVASPGIFSAILLKWGVGLILRSMSV